jgi:hypothetical protein
MPTPSSATTSVIASGALARVTVMAEQPAWRTALVSASAAIR